jgi:hypothetical protein
MFCGLPGVTTPQDANLNTVTISPKLYNKMDMSTIDMPETQEDKDDENHENKEPGDNYLVLPVAVVTDPISWFADVENAVIDTNRPFNPMGWQLQGRDGKWM